MATMIGNEDTLAELLQDLIELDYDAIEAYEEAIERLDNREYQMKLREFCEDHRRHTRNLGDHLREMDEEVPSGPGGKHWLTKGKVVLADMMGDESILKAMKSNEDDTNKAYERAVDHQDATPGVHETLRENLSDERRHRMWLEDVLHMRKRAA